MASEMVHYSGVKEPVAFRGYYNRIVDFGTEVLRARIRWAPGFGATVIGSPCGENEKTLSVFS